jgi:hypothetical protein
MLTSVILRHHAEGTFLPRRERCTRKGCSWRVHGFPTRQRRQVARPILCRVVAHLRCRVVAHLRCWALAHPRLWSASRPRESVQPNRRIRSSVPTPTTDRRSADKRLSNVDQKSGPLGFPPLQPAASMMQRISALAFGAASPYPDYPLFHCNSITFKWPVSP